MPDGHDTWHLTVYLVCTEAEADQVSSGWLEFEHHVGRRSWPMLLHWSAGLAEEFGRERLLRLGLGVTDSLRYVLLSITFYTDAVLELFVQGLVWTQIGHGVRTGRGCALASQVGIAGGARLGDGVILAGQVGVANRAVIGDRAIASSKSGIHGEVAAGEVVSGYPAIPNRLWLRCSAAFSKLPDMAKSLRELKRNTAQ